MASEEIEGFYDICRICMNGVDLQPILTFHDEFDDETLDLSHKLKVCCNVDVNLEDKMPKNICKSCCDALTAAYDLVMLCKQTGDTLRKYIETEKTNYSTKYSEESDYCDVEYLSDSDREYKPDVIRNKNVKRKHERAKDNFLSQDNKRKLQQEANNLNNSSEQINLSEPEIAEIKIYKDKMFYENDSNQAAIKKHKNLFLNITIPSTSPETETNSRATGTKKEIERNEIESIRYDISFGDKKLLMKPVNSLESHEDQKPKRYLISLGGQKILIKSCNKLISCDPIVNKPKYVFVQAPIINQNQSDVSKDRKVKKGNISQKSIMIKSSKKGEKVEIEAPGLDSAEKLKRELLEQKKKFLQSYSFPPRKKRQPLNKDWICDRCPYYTTNRQLFRQHLRTHEPKTIKLCAICPYRTTHQVSFNEHMKHTHMGVPLRQCDKCPYQTNSRNSFLNHMVVHSGEKKYSCTLCNYKTYNTGNLKIHMVKHSNERNFKCDQCDADYKIKRHLQLHVMRAHQNVKNYRCTPCRKTYVGEESYDRHMRKHAENKITKKSNPVKKKGKSKMAEDENMDNEKLDVTDNAMDSLTSHDTNSQKSHAVDSCPSDGNDSNAADAKRPGDWDSIKSYAADYALDIAENKKRVKEERVFNVVVKKEPLS